MNKGIPKDVTQLIKEMYTNLTSRIITDKTGYYFNFERWLKLGDPLSLILYNGVFEQICRLTKWNEKGISINGKRFNNLRFADKRSTSRDNHNSRTKRTR